MQGGRASVRVWAPACRRTDVVFDTPGQPQRSVALDDEGDGYFGEVVTGVAAGDLYRFRLDGDRLRPNPVSRFQPEGPHGPSAIAESVRRSVDRRRVAGHRIGRPRRLRDPRRHLHAGRHLGGRRARTAELARLGVTVIEMMPIADFRGPLRLGLRRREPLRTDSHSTARPTTCARFVDRAHARRHRGDPRRRLQPLRSRRQLPRGVLAGVLHRSIQERLGPGASTSKDRGGAGAYFVENAGYWIDEFHFDGLRLDATQDDPRRFVRARRLPRSSRAPGPPPAPGRSTSWPRTSPRTRRWCGRPNEGGYEVDALWNDDYHHTAVVALTGRREAYYTDYTGSPQEFVSSAKYGYLYPGAVVRVAEAAARLAGARSSVAVLRRVSWRITIRSPTRPTADGCIGCRRPAGIVR